MNLFVSIVI